MKYDMIPTTRGTKRSVRFEMSLSVPIFLAQASMIAIGNIDEKTSEISSRTMNLDMLNMPLSYESTIDIIKNKGMQIIGGFVKSETRFAIFSLFI